MENWLCWLWLPSEDMIEILTVLRFFFKSKFWLLRPLQFNWVDVRNGQMEDEESSDHKT